MPYIFSLINKCLGGKKCDWEFEGFWRFVLPHIITANTLKKYANQLNRELLILFGFGAINTQKKIDALYEASTLKNKALILSLVETFRIARGKDFVYPSFNLIDKDIDVLRGLCDVSKFLVYQDPEERLAGSFNW